MVDDNQSRQPSQPTERFRSGGRATGVLGLVIGAVMVVLALQARPPSWLVAAVGLLVVVVSWLVLLRPAVSVTDGRLVLRGMVSTVRLPLASVEEVMVRQMLVVGSDDRRFTSPAVGRKRSSLRAADHPGQPRRVGRGSVAGLLGMGRLNDNFQNEFGDPDGLGRDERVYGEVVEERLRQLSREARERNEPAGPPERTVDRLEVAAVVVSLVLVVVAAVAAAA